MTEHDDDAAEAVGRHDVDGDAHEAKTRATAAALALQAAGMASVLAAQAATLKRSVGTFTVAVQELDRRANRSRRVFTVAVAGLILDLALSGVVALALYRQATTSERLEQQIAQQNTVRTEVLCPLYGLLIASENPRSREAYAAGPAAYDDAFRVLREGSSTLRCETPS